LGPAVRQQRPILSSAKQAMEIAFRNKTSPKWREDLENYLTYHKNLPFFEETLRKDFHQIQETVRIHYRDGGLEKAIPNMTHIKSVLTMGDQIWCPLLDYEWAAELLKFAVVAQGGDKALQPDAILHIETAFEKQVEGPLRESLEPLLRSMKPDSKYLKYEI
ncbi:hypothetical protein H0H93_014992, partial [Arthromyces matolae]